VEPGYRLQLVWLELSVGLDQNAYAERSGSDFANAKRFAEMALSLAGLLGDSSTLKFLQGKLLEVTWY
jgi:hypothetical protein